VGKGLFLLQHPAKLCEQVTAVVRTGGRLGMVLDAERCQLPVSHSGDGVVVQVAVGDFQIAGQRVFFDREAVVLRRDFHLAVDHVQDGLVRSPVTELQLEGLGAASQAEQLMPEADAKDGFLAQQTADGFDCVVQRFWVAWTV
jgi:hypothetical protein